MKRRRELVKPPPPKPKPQDPQPKNVLVSMDEIDFHAFGKRRKVKNPKS